jgi:hypothetical protein
MMFLLRAAFWIGLVLILLPTGSKKQAGDETQIKAVDAVSAATGAVADLSQFCTRRPQPCEVGSQMAVALGHRAQAGAKMLYDLITAQTGNTESAPRNTDTAHGETTGSIGAGPSAMLPRPRPFGSQDTLTTIDRQPAWRAPPLRQEARLRQPI